MKKIAACASLLLGMGSTQAMAAIVTDQNNPTVSGAFCYMQNLCGQSFRQTHSNIAGAGVFASYVGSPGTVTISIYGSYGPTPGQLVAFGTSGIVSSSGWVDVFWSPAALDPTSTYYMVLSASSRMTVAHDGLAAYADGNALYNGNASQYAQYDLTFRTYYDDAAAVPEPGTLALFGLGLVAMVAARRRPRARRA